MISPCLYDNNEKKLTKIGMTLVAASIIILFIFIFIIMYKPECVCVTSPFTNFISNFTSPEVDVMKREAIEIPLVDLNKEPFNNDLPNPAKTLTDGDVDADYGSIIASEALEQSVFDQHKAYVNEKNKVTNTASRNPTRSDSQDLIPFVGLRRPQYQVNGKDMIDSTARQVPSIISADQLSKPNTLRW